MPSLEIYHAPLSPADNLRWSRTIQSIQVFPEGHLDEQISERGLRRAIPPTGISYAEFLGMRPRTMSQMFFRKEGKIIIYRDDKEIEYPELGPSEKALFVPVAKELQDVWESLVEPQPKRAKRRPATRESSRGSNAAAATRSASGVFSQSQRQRTWQDTLVRQLGRLVLLHQEQLQCMARSCGIILHLGCGATGVVPALLECSKAAHNLRGQTRRYQRTSSLHHVQEHYGQPLHAIDGAAAVTTRSSPEDTFFGGERVLRATVGSHGGSTHLTAEWQALEDKGCGEVLGGGEHLMQRRCDRAREGLEAEWLLSVWSKYQLSRRSFLGLVEHRKSIIE